MRPEMPDYEEVQRIRETGLGVDANQDKPCLRCGERTFGYVSAKVCWGPMCPACWVILGGAAARALVLITSRRDSGGWRWD